MAALGRASGKLELDASQLLFRAPAWPSTMHMPVNRRSLIGQHAAWGAAEFRLFAEGAAIAGLLDPPTCALPPNAPDPTAQRLNPDWGRKCTVSMGPLVATGSWWPTGVCHDPGRDLASSDPAPCGRRRRQPASVSFFPLLASVSRAVGLRGGRDQGHPRAAPRPHQHRVLRSDCVRPRRSGGVASRVCTAACPIRGSPAGSK